MTSATGSEEKRTGRGHQRRPPRAEAALAGHQPAGGIRTSRNLKYPQVYKGQNCGEMLSVVLQNKIPFPVCGGWGGWLFSSVPFIPAQWCSPDSLHALLCSCSRCVPALVVFLPLLFSCSHCVTSCAVFPLARCVVFLISCSVPSCVVLRSLVMFLCVVFLLLKCSFVRCALVLFASLHTFSFCSRCVLHDYAVCCVPYCAFTTSTAFCA